MVSLSNLLIGPSNKHFVMIVGFFIAMEEYEIDRYSQEVDKASKMNEWLGFGIGIFQAGTVLFLNGIVLSTLYYGNLLHFV